ncbi:putative protein kinase [Leptomonas pyrrhocoris]|uniref:non-specific serine/threonine protein kinase n=1 Tax=Leptomonas pyrrhocoris TaxID=157538 RepID=A0A0M9FP42_LEPPY|nr:putative protein kinase [Leptomonas pyrrhocoris]KPA73210.1 putative protein kinase [Leptomonas pyrrhocoris]|eukprot:XP_015651649.1 putative protein kinase [Leptomonas pyrrhocoris]
MALQEYEIIEKMASGAFGIVFKVRRITDHKVFVMKRIPLLGLNEDQRRDASQEIAVMRDLHHPCVVEQKDAFLYSEYDLCLILEYYDGGDMDARMAAQRELDVYFSFEQVMLWFVQLVLGAQYLHAHHVVHRDIKTHNVFVRRKDASVSLGDFGISERFNADLASRTWAAATMSGQGSSGNPAGTGTWTGGAREDRLYNGGTPNLETGVLHLQRTPSSSAQFTEGLHFGTPNASPHRPPPLQQPFAVLQRYNSNAGIASPYFGSPQSPWSGGGGKMEAVMKGTPLYMAPEVIQGGTASPKSDVWSLGCVLYELLALRHPFDSRDLATLVMRVSRGQREPLPVHYPRPIQELINRMLHLDAAQRPTCEEVLMMPCVRAYVELWHVLRTPLDVPASLSETALAKQIIAWQANVKAAALKNPTDPRYASLHHSEMEHQLMPPACSPSEEREATEKRATEAARAALLLGGPSFSSCGALSFNGTAAPAGGVGGMAEGTFFFGDSGRRMTAAMNGTGGDASAVDGPTEMASFPSAVGGNSDSAVAAAGAVPTESMRPFMVYDSAPSAAPRPSLSLESPTHARHSADSPCRSASGAARRRPPPQKKRKAKKTAQKQQHRRRADPPHPASPSSSPSSSFASPTASATSSHSGQQQRRSGRHHRASFDSNDHRRSDPNSPDPTAAPTPFDDAPLPSTSPPPFLRAAAPPPNKPLLTAGVTPLPAPPLDEEALFFKAFHNVVDMRYASMADIADAVAQLRQRVQQRMRHQRILLDIELLHSRHGSAPLQSMPNVLNVLATAAAASPEGEGAEEQRRSADGRPAVTPRSSSSTIPQSPEDVYIHMVQQIHEERGDRQRQEAMDEAWAHAHGMTDGHAKHSYDAALPVGRPSPTRIRQLREVAALAEAEAARVRLQRQQAELDGASSAGGVPFADPAAPLRLSTKATADSDEAAQRQRWSVYIQRRNSLSASLVRVFDPVTLRAVYKYYLSRPLLQRDVNLVRRLVPDRSQWTALPLVEELVVLDRSLQPLLDRTE